MRVSKGALGVLVSTVTCGMGAVFGKAWPAGKQLSRGPLCLRVLGQCVLPAASACAFAPLSSFGGALTGITLALPAASLTHLQLLRPFPVADRGWAFLSFFVSFTFQSAIKVLDVYCDDDTDYLLNF